MPNVKVGRRITVEEAAEDLRDRLPQHKVTVNHGGASGSLRVGRGLSVVNIHVTPDGETTIFRVHGSGFIIGRAINELGLARKVSRTLGDTFGSSSDADRRARG